MKNTFFTVITENERKLPFYLIGVGCMYTQEPVCRPEGYPHFQWIQCSEGEGELIIEGNTYTIKPNQGMFLYPNIPHEYYALREPWQVDWITFGGHQLEYLVRSLGFTRSEVLSVVNGDSILSKARKALSVAQSDNSLKGVECSGIVYELLLDLFKYASRDGDDSIQHQHSKLQPVFEYVEKNYSRIVSLEDLSSTLGVTPQHLCLLFRTIMKIRPFEYLNTIRINKSKDLMIKHRDMEVKEISKLVGFESPSYFCSIFKRFEGISPNTFRKLHGL